MSVGQAEREESVTGIGNRSKTARKAETSFCSSVIGDLKASADSEFLNFLPKKREKEAILSFYQGSERRRRFYRF